MSLFEKLFKRQPHGLRFVYDHVHGPDSWVLYPGDTVLITDEGQTVVRIERKKDEIRLIQLCGFVRFKTDDLEPFARFLRERELVKDVRR